MLTYVKFNFFYGNQVSHIKINNISSSLLLLKFFFIPYHLFIFKNKNIFFHKTSMFDFLKIFFRNNKNIYIMLLKYNLLGFSFDSFTNKCSQSAINAISILTPESKYSQNIGNSVILRNNKKSLLNFLKFKNFFFFLMYWMPLHLLNYYTLLNQTFGYNKCFLHNMHYILYFNKSLYFKNMYHL